MGTSGDHIQYIQTAQGATETESKLAAATARGDLAHVLDRAACTWLTTSEACSAFILHNVLFVCFVFNQKDRLSFRRAGDGLN